MIVLLRFALGGGNFAISAGISMGAFAWQGQVVVITGASGGIGAACARALDARGAQLVLNARSESGLAALNLPDALLLHGDITLAATREQLVARTLDRFGRVDVLVNNAGVGVYWPPSAARDEDTRRMFEVNFFAPLALAQAVVPAMRRQRSGVIVNISSIAGKVTLPWLTLYSASKFALSSATAGLRMELARDGIHVMAVYPGYVKTQFQDHAIGAYPPPEIAKGKRFAISAQQCARDILRGVERRSRSVVTPGWWRGFAGLHLLFPSLVEARLIRMNAGGGHR